jgi:hypothetical protein
MTPFTRFAPFAALLIAVVAGSSKPAPAQDKDKDKELVAKAKTAAAENLKKCKIDKPTVVETEHFLVAGSLPADKAKALGAVLERTLAVARKGAKFDDKDVAWKGKLTVYFLPDSEEYKAFMRRVLQTTPEGVYADLRTDPPLLVDPAELPGKPTEADLYAATAGRVAGELLRAKGTGTQVVPAWLRDGFGRVSALRAEGTTSKRYTTYRKEAAAAVYGAKTGRPAALDDVWSGAQTPAGVLLANSFAEFLAYGPRANDFGKFLDALRPSETVPNPTAEQHGFEALGWKDKAAPDAAWKKWVGAGK